jgi:TusE/DsrC/DsvC family sulfur relay protein
MDDDLVDGKPLDDDGFLQSNKDWSRAVAHELAQINELGPLTEQHWQIIEFVRMYYAEHDEGPPIVKIAKATGLTSKCICTLFPCGVAKGAYRLAGLPRPTGCL